MPPEDHREARILDAASRHFLRREFKEAGEGRAVSRVGFILWRTRAAHVDAGFAEGAGVRLPVGEVDLTEGQRAGLERVDGERGDLRVRDFIQLRPDGLGLVVVRDDVDENNPRSWPRPMAFL